MSEDRMQPTDPEVAAQLEEWRDSVGAPPPGGLWRGPAKFVATVLVLLFVVPVAVRYVVYSPLVETTGAGVLVLVVCAMPLIVIGIAYGAIRIRVR